MIDQWEQDVRAVFAEDAAAAPVVADLAAKARRRVRRQRTVRAAWVAAPLAAASAAVVAIATGASSFGGGPADDPVVAPAKRAETADPLPDPSTDPDAITGSGELQAPADSVTLCQEYKPETLDDADLAFDGTVAHIAPAPDRVVGEIAMPEVTVTFTVHEWFRGGSDSVFVAAMTPPDGGIMMKDMAPPAYGIGTRLLVSGVLSSAGDTVNEPIVWDCGFTRYYDDATAAEWRKVFE